MRAHPLANTVLCASVSSWLLSTNSGCATTRSLFESPPTCQGQAHHDRGYLELKTAKNNSHQFASFAGTVGAAESGPISEATVILAGDSKLVWSGAINAYTNTEGRFFIHRVPAGVYDLSVRARGTFILRKPKLLVQSGQHLEIQACIVRTRPDPQEERTVSGSTSEPTTERGTLSAS